MTTAKTETLTQDIKDTISSALNEIKRNTPNFKNRKSQLYLIAETARTLAGFHGKRRILVAEAPTGTGKSIGYMLGAIPVAQAQDKKIVIATGTVALQEQLVNRDIPSLQKKSGLDFTFALAKGRGRYVCNRNLLEMAGSSAKQESLDLGDPGDAAWTFEPSDEQILLVNKLDRALDKKTWSGDFDEWTGEAIDEKLKGSLTTDQASCTGRDCPHFYKCAFHISREKMRNSDVIVANHDLVMADINTLGGGKILSEPEETFYIFDEAHHLPDVALAHGANETSFHWTLEDLKRAPKNFAEAYAAAKIPVDKSREIVNGIKLQSSELTNAIKSMESLITSSFPVERKSSYKQQSRKSIEEDRVWRFENGVVAEHLLPLANTILKMGMDLRDHCSTTQEKLKKAIKNKAITADEAARAGKSMVFLEERLNTLVKTWSIFVTKDKDGWPPNARWFTLTAKNARLKKKSDLILSCCPTSAATILKFGLWERAAGVVLASATVSSLGNFNRFAERAGLGLRDGTQYIQLPSPFDYKKNGELYIPFMNNDPSNTEQHTNEVVSLLDRMIDPNQGTLVLFSARRQMLDVADKISERLHDILLIQGEKSKNEILEEHEKRISRNEGSIIFGLASFSEGVDLPGKLCEQVFIAKLPFAVPDSPIDATYSEWLTSVGRNPFLEISVPDACTKLVQSCGRLIRTESDSGRVTLLDRRVVTKRYGPQMLDSLPPFKRNIETQSRVA